MALDDADESPGAPTSDTVQFGSEAIPATEAKPEDDIETFRKLKGWYKESMEFLADWRKEAEEDYGFVSGEDQWTAEERAILKEASRPVVTFNRVNPTVDSVTGLEVGNRQEVTYIPREVGDSAEDELITNVVKFFRDESDVEDEESDAFLDVTICGLAALEVRPDYESDREGLIPTERLDPLTVFYDPAAKKRNLVDRQFCGYERELSLDDAKAMFPDVDESELHAGWSIVGGDTPGSSQKVPGPEYYQQDGSASANSGNASRMRDKVKVIYFEWWEREPYYLIHDQFTGQPKEIDEEDGDRLKERLPQLGLTFNGARLTRKVYKHAFIGGKILKSGPGRCKDEFTVNFMTGKRDRNRNYWYGVVKAMKDPQRWANKFLSQTMHVMNSNAKGGVMAETSAVDDVRKFEDTWADPSGITWLAPGGIAKVQQKPPVQYPQGLDRLLQFAIASMPQVTGLNLELLGLVEREQAGVLEAQRKQAGMTILASLFDSLRRYRKISGRVYLYLIQNYIPQGRLIRIDSVNGPKYAPLVLNPMVTKYDVIVDTSPTSPNEKERVFQVMSQLLPVLLKSGVPIPPEIVQYAPLPDSLTEKWMQEIQQARAAPPAPDPRVEAEKALVAIKAQSAQQDAQLQAQKAQQESQLKTITAFQDMEIARQQSEAEIARDNAKAENDIRMARMKHDSQVEMAQQKAAMQEEAGSREKNGTVIQLSNKDDLANMAETLAGHGRRQSDDMIRALGDITDRFSTAMHRMAEGHQALAEAMNAPRELVRTQDGRKIARRLAH